MPNSMRHNPRRILCIVGGQHSRQLTAKRNGFYNFYDVADINSITVNKNFLQGMDNIPLIAKRDLLYLKNRLARVASKSTSPDSKAYAKQDNPLYGHCFVMALFVRHAFGGVIVRGREPESLGGGTHFWNILPTGQEVDLTSCQYGSDGLSPVFTPELVLVLEKRLWQNKRYKTLVERLRRQPV